MVFDGAVVRLVRVASLCWWIVVRVCGIGSWEVERMESRVTVE